MLTAPVVLLAPDMRTHRETGPRYRVSEAADQELYHLPVVRAMAADLPRVDLVEYDSATSPGYHLLMALVVRTLGDRVAVLQFLNIAIGLALVLAVRRIAGASGPCWALIAPLPLLCSNYLLTGAIWLTTDNLALLFVVLALMACVATPGARPRTVLAGVLAACAVGVRQIHVWLAAPIGLAALIRSGCFRALIPGALFPPDADAPTDPRERRRAFVIACVGAAIPFALLAVFVALWGGLMPPKYRDLHASGANPALPAFALALCACFGAFYLPGALRLGTLRTLHPRILRDPAPWIGAALGAIAAIIPATSHSPEDGRRYGWLWELVRLAPAPHDRSLLLLILAPIGGATLALLWRAAQRAGRAREASLLLFASLAWCAAQSANTQAWQRYSEPFVLIIIIWLASLARTNLANARADHADTHTIHADAHTPAPTRSPAHRALDLAPLALAALQLALTLWTVHRPALLG
ncbi:MAG: hypothetical protein EA379_00660 [Phycisphaerales bacterium]|nr:MAG: hypothetical protein EA379_00660 [Phycisphaerales bacterium]